jgi:hypothetical protein
MPVFGAGGGVVAAIELGVPELDEKFSALLTALTIATRSLSRELGGDAREMPVEPRAAVAI